MGGDREHQVKIQIRLKQSIDASFPSHHVRPNGSSFGFPAAKAFLPPLLGAGGFAVPGGQQPSLPPALSPVHFDVSQRSSLRSALPMPPSPATARNDLLTSFHPSSPSSLLKTFVSQILRLLPSSPKFLRRFFFPF